METSFACYGRRIRNRETNGSLYNPCRGEVGPSHCTLLNRFISKRKIKEDKRIQPQLPADRTTILRRSIRSGEGGRLQITFRRRISSLPTNPILPSPLPNHHFQIANDVPGCLHADFNFLPKRTNEDREYWSRQAEEEDSRRAIIIITRPSRSKSPAVE